jgi:hypothetical protein
MSTLKNRADLVDEALANLGIIQQPDTAPPMTRADVVKAVSLAVGPGAVGQTLNADDYDAINETIDTIFPNLNARGIATITNMNAIPAAWFDSLVAIVAEGVKEKYGATGEFAARLEKQAQEAETQLLNLTRSFVVERNIDPILAELVMDQIVYLVDADEIPDEWFASLAAIVADRCKGKGFMLDAGTIQRVTLEGQMAMTTLRRITRAKPAYLVMQSEYF